MMLYEVRLAPVIHIVSALVFGMRLVLEHVEDNLEQLIFNLRYMMANKSDEVGCYFHCCKHRWKDVGVSLGWQLWYV